MKTKNKLIMATYDNGDHTDWLVFASKTDNYNLLKEEFKKIYKYDYGLDFDPNYEDTIKIELITAVGNLKDIFDICLRKQNK